MEFDFRPLEYLFYAMVVALIISVPLAVWKGIEIVVWIIKNVSVSVN